MRRPRDGRDALRAHHGVAGRDTANQIAVGGYATYPRAAATLGAGTVSYRPITGGTGRYAGVRGWLKTTHFSIGHWRQEFHFCPNR